ncbi:MAG: hypothetical protein Q9169_001089 [Polycauliona sp. 2 TL-2023]
MTEPVTARFAPSLQQLHRCIMASSSKANIDDVSPTMRLKEDLDNAALGVFETGRPLLTHLNADTSWLLTIPYPRNVNPPPGRFLFNILIDPWFRYAQTDYFSWFSRQWHVIPSSVQTIAELNEGLETMETTIGERHTSSKESIHASTSTLEDLKANYIDMVIISHEFTDHCNQETLREIASSTLVLAPKPAAHLISSWRHFQRVQSIEAFSDGKHEGQDASTSGIPPWLRIARIISNKDAMSFHSAILISFDIMSSPTGASVEGIVYTPHGINAKDLEQLSLASPHINVLALLHDDEVKKAGGLVNHLLRRKIWTIEDVLKEEKKRNETLNIGSPLADIRDIHFANLESGESLLLR